MLLAFSFIFLSFPSVSANIAGLLTIVILFGFIIIVSFLLLEIWLWGYWGSIPLAFIICAIDIRIIIFRKFKFLYIWHQKFENQGIK